MGPHPRPTGLSRAGRMLSFGLLSCVCVMVGGCGAGVVLRAPCTRGAVRVLAGAVDVPAARVRAVRSVGNNDQPQCELSAAGRASVLVNVDSAPQAYFRFERTIEEFQQVFSPQRQAPAPEFLTGLGLGAAWLPATDQFLTTDARRLITVNVRWPRASTRSMIRLAEAEARRYLGRNDLAAARMSP